VPSPVSPGEDATHPARGHEPVADEVAMSVRTFLALDIDEHVRSRLAELPEQIDTGRAKVRWVTPRNLHITLRFLGNVADDVLHTTCELVAATAAEIAPFDFAVRGLQCMPPHGRRLRMIWARVRDLGQSILPLYERLEIPCDGLGLPGEDRAYKPHITLGRIKFARNPGKIRSQVEALGERDFGLVHAHEVVAYTSALTREGPVYTAVARAPLGG
jgi:2'-5' RNA ligase